MLMTLQKTAPSARFCQVFINSTLIQKLVALRVRYMLAVLKEAPVSIPDLVLATSANVKSMLENLADSAEGSDTYKTLVLYDALQTAATWVQARADALNAPSVAEVVSYIRQQTGMAELKPSSFDSLSSEAKKPGLGDGSGGQKTADSEVDGHGLQIEGDGGKVRSEDHPAADASGSTSMNLKQLHVYRDEKCIKSQAEKGIKIFEESDHARVLNVKHFSAAGVMQIQKGLEAALWDTFMDESKGCENILVDFGKGKKDAVTVKLPLPSQMILPFMGPVSQSKGTKGIKVCSVFGIDFYIHPCGEHLQTAEVLVPAWHSKAVTKADQVYFSVGVKTVRIYMTAEGPDLSSVNFFACKPKDDGTGTIFTEVDCSIQFLEPVKNLQAKLEADHKARRQRAEKAARNAINSSIRQSQQKSKKEKASAKSRGSKRGRAQEDADNEQQENTKPGNGAGIEEMVKDMEKKVQEDEEKIEKLVVEAVEQCKAATSIPINRLSSDGERTQNSTRALLMQSVLKEKEQLQKNQAKLLAETESNDPVPGKVGAAAAVQTMNRDGILQAKKKKTGDSAATVAAENVMKLGKHVLK